MLVSVARITAVVALAIAVPISPLLSTQTQAFQYIQEYTGLVSPGILAVFLCGLLYKKTASIAAIIGILASIVVALSLKLLPINMPFIDEMMYTLVLTTAVIIFVSLSTNPEDEDPKAIRTTAETFRTSGGFAVAAYAVLLFVAMIYAALWDPHLGFMF